MSTWSTAIHEAQKIRHDKTVSDFEVERKKLLATINEKEKQLEAALGICGSKPVASKIKLDQSSDAEATFVAVASDWHVEETVEAKTINGLNEYNLDIAAARIEKFWQSIARMATIQRAGAKIDRLVLVLGGDLMTGYIHEELIEGNALSPTQTVLWLQDQLASGINFLSKHFGEIVIPCVWGNHSRTCRKPRHATGAANSYEWMLYKTMAKHMGDKAVWHVSDGYHLLLDLYGKTLRIHHGDGLQYQGGVGGLTIPVEKAIASWNKGVSADLDIFGHWHQSQQNPKWVCNGCFTGDAKVMTPNGVVEIRDVKEGDKVFAHDGSLQTVEATMQKISEDGLIEIRAKGLPDFIKCTPNHEFFAIKGESQLRQRLSPMKTHPNKEKPRWIKAEDLSEGDWVCTPELQGDMVGDTDLLWVYGLFTAEGHSLIGAGAKGYVNKIGFTMHIKELPVLERAKSILDKHFGKSGYIYTREKKTISGLEYCGKEIAEQWQAWFGHTCYEKKIPNWVFYLNKECREAFVQGWYDGDGHRCKQMGGTSASRQLAWGIHWLSVGTRFNSMLYLRNKRPKGHVKGFCESYHLGFVKGQDVAFVDGRRFVRIDYRGRLDDKVVVFDLQVSGPHTYNVGGMGVHNSLIGFNAYSIAIKAPYEPPSQTGFIFDKKRGRTVTFPIFVD